MDPNEDLQKRRVPRQQTKEAEAMGGCLGTKKDRPVMGRRRLAV